MSNPQAQPLPLYDLFLDLPHPAAAASCPPAFTYAYPNNSPEIEKELSANMSRISRFAFPEFDDTLNQRIPRDTTLNRFSQYAMQPKSFQNYTFSLQLQSGVRVHGFVRRYLPIHQMVEHRYDVGRRGERALILLTRFSGGDLLYASILKTVDAISFQKAAAKCVNPEPQKWFLNRIFEEHKRLSQVFLSMPQQDRKPIVMSIGSLEVGEKPIRMLNQVDTTKFLIPTSLLSKTSMVEALTSSPILPLLRVLGVSSTLRLLSALLSENRVLLVSANPTRLAQCARSALSILSQGLLNWQHLYIPVLPPHLFQYLGAPVPYLIGMLASFLPKLNQVQSDSLGEMVIINLDNNQMETRGMNPMDVARKVPDLFQKAISEQGMPASTMSASEMLAQDLIDLLKVDKRVLYGESTLTNVSETAAKATKAMKSGISSLARKGKKFLKNRKGSQIIDGVSGTSEEEDLDDAGNTSEVDLTTMTPDIVYIQGSRNEAAEEEARIAFSSFFLSMVGNMRWYLSASPGQLPHLDRNRFLQQKRAMGEGESTPVWPLLQNFCQSQMLEEFAKARVEEVRLRLPVTADSPLFTQCANYHRLNNIDFSVVNVRRVARQVAQNSPSRANTHAPSRRMAMLLTSNKTYEGDYNKAVARLVEECRECTSVLFDVMSVIWVRMRDSKGVHWKHGLQALQVLRNLLYHGPMTAVAEATDGLDKIRAMKFYNDHMRSQICTQIRQAAHQVYNLLVDRAKLFHIRRICVNKRRLLSQPEQGRYTRDSRISIMHRFGAMHQLMNPKSAARVAPAPHSGPVPSMPRATVEHDIFGLTTGPPAPVTPAPRSADAAQDIVGLFGNVTVSNPVPAGATKTPVHDPFAQTPVMTREMTPTRPPAAQITHTASNGTVSSPQMVAPHPRDPFAPTSASNAPQMMQNTPGSNPERLLPSQSPAPKPQNPFASASTPHRPIPATPNQQVRQNTPVSNPSPAVTTQTTSVHTQHPYPQARQTPQPFMNGSPQVPTQGTAGTPVTNQPNRYGVAYGQKPNVATPTIPHQSQVPNQHYYHPTPQNGGLHPSTGYSMPPQQQQQYGQIGQQRPPPQQYYQQHHPQQPASHQLYASNTAVPAQPTKPNISQFDPFQ